MRKAINENRKVQALVICALLAAGALMLMTQMNKGGDVAASGEFPGSETPPAAEVSVSSVNGESVGSAAVSLPQGATAAAPTAAPAPETVSKAALKPGPGLPAPVVRAWEGGDAVVLLVAKDAAVDDRLVHDSVAALSGRAGVTVFVTPASEVARYSRIAQGVGVDRAPALVVIRPKRLSGSVPQATVEYGFRSAQGVEQAVDDALYSGRDNVPYHPG
ncbi:MAG: hypothetical protein ACXWZ3_03220 [Solirubrobacterales bacterium]